MKNAKKFLEKITTQKINKEDAEKLYSNLITPDITELENMKAKGKNKRNNIWDVLKNLESVFIGVYFYYKDVPLESEESITEGKKLRRQRLDEFERKEQNIKNELFKEYFTDYQSSSNIYKNLSETEGAVNKVRVDSIEKILSNYKESLIMCRKIMHLRFKRMKR